MDLPQLHSADLASSARQGKLPVVKQFRIAAIASAISYWPDSGECGKDGGSEG